MEKYVHLREEIQDTDFGLDNVSSPADCAKVMSCLAEHLVHSTSRTGFLFVSKGSVTAAADPALLVVSKPFLPTAPPPTVLLPGPSLAILHHSVTQADAASSRAGSAAQRLSAELLSLLNREAPLGCSVWCVFPPLLPPTGVWRIPQACREDGCRPHSP